MRNFLAVILCLGFFALCGWVIYVQEVARQDRVAERKAFLEETQGVVKVTGAKWIGGKFSGWRYEVTGFLGGKTYTAVLKGGGDRDQNSSKVKVDEFWKVEVRSYGSDLLLVEKTKCP